MKMGKQRFNVSMKLDRKRGRRNELRESDTDAEVKNQKFKGGDAGESALSVATCQAGGSGHHLPEGQIVLEERSHDLEKLPRAIPLVQL
ncbi:hypothetical protein EYF80_024644 [Liparis tanakae]|uniref:Uncharacterized protein n=1 Tax=Liparis tanakae TaxID=230148 RepID=A0A4Z2HIN9_9TELE|nr:hypothetical protein EYF80_024644 [Liparis tanakae]